jgi:acetylornithine deacetylase
MTRKSHPTEGEVAALREELGRLIAYRSVSSRPLLDLGSHLATRAEDAGFRVERFEPVEHPGKCTIVASIGPHRGDGSGLVVSGHMDVVPTDGQPWTTDPFALTERDGRWFGRGVADMKGFLAVASLAIRRIPRADWKRELVLIWTHDEEVGCLGSAALADAWQGRPMPTACWIGEPTGMRILRMHPGHVAAEFEIQGKAAHSSRPDLGRNAISAAARAVVALEAEAERFRAEPVDLPEMDRPWVPVNVAEIHGGVAINVVPDRCTVRLGYRHLPGQDPHAPFERLRAAIGPEVCGCPVHGRVVRVTHAMLTAAGTPLEGLLRPHARDPRLGAATFATDGANLTRLGMAPLVFGPGAIEVAHQADEHVDIGEIAAAVDAAEDILRRACCDPSPQERR